MNLADFLKENPDAKKDLDKMVEDQASAAVSKATESLTSKNEQLLDELKPLKDLKTKLGDDFDLDDYNKLRREMADKKKQGFVDKGEIEKLIEEHEKEKAQLVAEHKKVVDDLTPQLETAKAEIQRLVVDGELTRELSAVAVDDSALDYLAYKAKPLIETVEADGKTTARMKGGVKADGSHKTIKDLVAELAGDEQFARYVKGSGKSGSGAPNSSGGAGGNSMKRADFEQLDPKAAAKHFAEGGTVVD